MELWFIYAVASALFGGLHTFVLKVAAVRNHGADANTTITSLCSAAVGWLLVLIFNLHETQLGFLILFAVFGGTLYSFGAAARVESLKCIDTTIFFPLYKVIGPLVAVVAGIFIFSETLDMFEIFGIVLSLIVPLLLLHRDEKTRQKSLTRGLLLLLLSVALIMLAHVTNKHATSLFDNMILFVALTHTFTFLVSVMLWHRHSIKNGTKLTKTITSNLIYVGMLSGFLQFAGFYTILKAFELGALSVVFTVNSLYIVIPIALSIIIYKEHWNARKVFAIVLSIVALAFLK